MLRKIWERKREGEEGFTLIELLVVVIIIGILAAIAIPVFLNQRKKAWDAAAKSDVKNMSTAEETYLSDPTSKGNYTSDVSKLEEMGFKKSEGVEHGACFTNGSNYVVGAKHTSSDNYWYFDSSTGQLGSDTGGVVGVCDLDLDNDLAP